MREKHPLECLDGLADVSSDQRLTGTRVERWAGDEVAEVFKKAPKQQPRDVAPAIDQEIQLRGLRRAVVEQVLRSIKQIRDARTAPTLSADQVAMEKLFAGLEAVAPEELYNPKTPAVARFRKTKIPKSLAGSEEATLIASMQQSLDTSFKMTGLFDTKSSIREQGGLRALFPDLQRDFTDVTAPHVDSFNRAVSDGVNELLAELKGELDVEAVSALPKFFVLTVDAKKDNFRIDPSTGVFTAKKSFSNKKDWKAATTVEKAVTNILSKPPGAMIIRFSRLNQIANVGGSSLAWVVTLEREAYTEEEVLYGGMDEDINKIKSKKKRLAKLLSQKAVEEREAGGARRLMQAINATLAATDASATLAKVYVRSELSRVLTGFEQAVDAPDGPHSTPCGRAALHKIFKSWATDFIQLAAPKDKERNRGLLQPYVEWLDQKYDAATPTPTPAPSASRERATRAEHPLKRRRLSGRTDGLLSAETTVDDHVAANGGREGDRHAYSESNAGESALAKQMDGSLKNPFADDALLSLVDGQEFSEHDHDFADLNTMMRTALPEAGSLVGNPLIEEDDEKEGEQKAQPTTEEYLEALLESDRDFFEGEGNDDSGHNNENLRKKIGRAAVFDPSLPHGTVASLKALYQVLITTRGSPLHPQSHRLHKSNYTVPLFVQVTYSYTVSQDATMNLFSVSDWVYGGEVPVMVRSSACMLADKTSGELSQTFAEESREPGGYFIMRGNERVLRMVLVARGNHPITIERASFANKGPSFTSKCVFVRSVKRSGIACPNYLYMLSSGKIILSFSRGSTWQIPLSLILLSLGDDLTPLQLAEKMSSDDESNKWVAAFMADVFNQIQLAKNYVAQDQAQEPGAELPTIGFPSNAQHWQYVLGRYLVAHKKVWVREILNKCRARLGAGAYDSEVYRYVGLWAIRCHVLPHLNDYTMPFQDAVGERKNKIESLLVMVRKLVMFQSGRLSEEGEDGLVNQEVITPGQLWLNGVMDSVLAIGRGLRSSLSLLGLTDNRARSGWEDLRPSNIDAFSELCCGKGENRLRELIWSYFWQRRRVEAAKPASTEPETLAGKRDLNVLNGLSSLVDNLHKKHEKQAYYWKMRYELVEEADDDRKGNRQRVLSEPTYPICFMVSTGNYTQEPLLANGASLPQSSGWSVVVERINQFRFLEQFRATHRGKTIQEMRTTTPRRYQMDGWGFLCIVHTPDGGPCGVMNHLTYPTQIVSGLTAAGRLSVKGVICKTLKKKFGASGGYVSLADTTNELSKTRYPVMLDSELIGYISEEYLAANKLVHNMDSIKKNVGTFMRELREKGSVPNEVEIVSVDPKWVYSQQSLTGVTRDVDDVTRKAPKLFPGLYMFTGPGRLSRPIRKVGGDLNKWVWVGTQEQIFLDIAALHKDIGSKRGDLGEFDFVEINTTTALSLTASLIPYFEMNCSPRNLFQCGMAKQTMGSCFHSIERRNDNKLYHTHACQAALLRTDNQHFFQMDDYPNGINVVLAVAAYTGFDMEDALLINKSSVERGLFQGSVYLGTILQPFASDTLTYYTKLPTVGLHLTKGQEYAVTNTGKRETWSKAEAGTVHAVEVLEMDLEEEHPIRVRVIFRIQRTPVVGDKFAARHGQKGTLPLLIPQV